MTVIFIHPASALVYFEIAGSIEEREEPVVPDRIEDYDPDHHSCGAYAIFAPTYDIDSSRRLHSRKSAMMFSLLYTDCLTRCFDGQRLCILQK